MDGRIDPAHPTDDQLDLRHLEAKSTPQTLCHVPETIPEQFLLALT